MLKKAKELLATCNPYALLVGAAALLSAPTVLIKDSLEERAEKFDSAAVLIDKKMISYEGNKYLLQKLLDDAVFNENMGNNLQAAEALRNFEIGLENAGEKAEEINRLGLESEEYRVPFYHQVLNMPVRQLSYEDFTVNGSRLNEKKFHTLNYKINLAVVREAEEGVLDLSKIDLILLSVNAANTSAKAVGQPDMNTLFLGSNSSVGFQHSADTSKQPQP